MTEGEAPPMDDNQRVRQALDAGIARYFAGCHRRVEPFVKRHFRYPGAWRTNRRALGWDLVRSPLNLLWAPVYLLARAIAWLLRRARVPVIPGWLERVPSGMRTRIQRYLIERTHRELLGRRQGRDRLHQCIIDELMDAPDLADLSRSAQRQLQASLDDALEQYALTRTAGADLSNTLLATIAGAFTLQKFTPGALAIGLTLASIVANRMAAGTFILGPWLGGWYYQLFPVVPGAGLVFASTAGVLMLFAVFACFSGLISDPVQALLGLHQKRLHRLLRSLERDMQRRRTGSFRPKDAYLARLMDIIDAARTGLH